MVLFFNEMNVAALTPDTAVTISIKSVIASPVQHEKLNKCWFINEFATLLSLHPAATRHIHPGRSCLHQNIPRQRLQQQREAITESGLHWGESVTVVSAAPAGEMSWELTSGLTGNTAPDDDLVTTGDNGPGARWGSGVRLLSYCVSNICFVEFYLMESGNLWDGPNYLGWEFATDND